MILSHKYRFIFFCNGKTGTTSIEHALKDYDESGNFDCGASGLWVKKHIPPAVLKAFLPERTWQEYFKIVFVRHPQDWFISQYKHNFREPAFPARQLLRHPWKTGSIIREYHGRKARASKECLDVADVDFLYQYLRQFRALPGSPSLEQSSYVYDVDGKTLVDFIGKFENLEQDVEAMKERVGIEFDLPHLNKTSHKPFQECFTQAASARIGKLYKADFANFGYEIEQGAAPDRYAAPLHSGR